MDINFSWKKLMDDLRVLIYKLFLEIFYGKKKKKITNFFICDIKTFLK